jgi:glyoxylase-like metal-dependent hydrolase (beta-lactamase superfamily II)
VIVDPGDPTGETTDAIVAAADAAGAAVAGVLVSDLEPDRHAGVELFARGLGLPVAGPPGADAIAPYAITDLRAGEPVPIGDAGLVVEIVRPEARHANGTRSWADRAGRLRLRLDGGAGS